MKWAWMALERLSYSQLALQRTSVEYAGISELTGRPYE